MKMKYIVIEWSKLHGETMLIFPETIQHDQYAQCFEIDDKRDAISAGFIVFKGDEYRVDGGSISLNLNSRPIEDTKLLKQMFGDCKRSDIPISHVLSIYKSHNGKVQGLDPYKYATSYPYINATEVKSEYHLECPEGHGITKVDEDEANKVWTSIGAFYCDVCGKKPTIIGLFEKGDEDGS